MDLIKENESFEFWKEDNIICYKYKKPEIDLELAKMVVFTCHEIAGITPSLLYSDLTNVKSATKEARDFFVTSDPMNVIKAVALFAPSVFSKIIANFFIHFNKPKIPVKMFSSKDKALEWLNTINLN